MKSFKKILVFLKKWFILLLIVLFIIPTESCSVHHRYKKMLKRRQKVSMKRYRSPYQRKIKRRAIPINKNYIIKIRKSAPYNSINRR